VSVRNGGWLTSGCYLAVAASSCPLVGRHWARADVDMLNKAILAAAHERKRRRRAEKQRRICDALNTPRCDEMLRCVASLKCRIFVTELLQNARPDLRRANNSVAPRAFSASSRLPNRTRPGHSLRWDQKKSNKTEKVLDTLARFS